MLIISVNSKTNVFFRLKMSGMCLLALFIIVFISTPSYSQGGFGSQFRGFEWSDEVYLPVNSYDNFSFDKSTRPYIRNSMYYVAPALLTVWGLAEWGWMSQSIFIRSSNYPFGHTAKSGGADKFGHLLGTYTIKRFSTFLFQSTGSSEFRANIEGALFAEVFQTITEFGDGFSTAHGFDVMDYIFNQIGILSGIILDYFPTLDRMISLQWEWVPASYFKKNLNYDNMDAFSDYSGQKYFIVLKCAGIPYLSRTPMRYVNFDLGYYARGYNCHDPYRTQSQNIQVGLSINFAIVSGDILPTGYVSSTAQSVFKYYHVPYDYEKRLRMTSTRE